MNALESGCFYHLTNDSFELKRLTKFVVVNCYCVHGQSFNYLVWSFTSLYKNTWHVCRLLPKFVAWLELTAKLCRIVLHDCKKWFQNCGSLQKILPWLWHTFNALESGCFHHCQWFFRAKMTYQICRFHWYCVHGCIFVTHFQPIGKRMFSPIPMILLR